MVALSPGKRYIDIQRDNALDHIAFLQEKQARTRNFLNRLAAEVDQITAFDIIEALDILNEDRIESDARRFHGVVLDSETQN